MTWHKVYPAAFFRACETLMLKAFQFECSLILIYYPLDLCVLEDKGIQHLRKILSSRGGLLVKTCVHKLRTSGDTFRVGRCG